MTYVRLVRLGFVALVIAVGSSPKASTVTAATSGAVEVAGVPPVPTTRPPIGSVSDESGPGWAVAFVVGLVAAGAGVALGIVVGRRRPSVAGHAAPPAPPPPGSPHDRRDRDALVEVSVTVADVVPSQALKDRLHAGLIAAGLSPLDPAGQRVDPALHHVVGTTPTDDPGLDGVIASTDRVGWDDRGRLLRPPAVVIYRSGN